jgi:hypothetical protein
MKIVQLFVLSLFFQSISSQACLNTYQFKIFPVGMTSDTIVTVDMQIRRTSQSEGNRWLKLGLDSADEWTEMWMIDGFISKYDKTQHLLSKESIGFTFSLKESYLDTLQAFYQKGYASIHAMYPALKLFNPVYLSYCNFQQSCEYIKLTENALTKKSYFVYQDRSYQLSVLEDTSYYGFDQSGSSAIHILKYYANSIRVYKLDDVELVISHVATGHEISMGWIVSDPKVAEKMEAKGETAMLVKEYKPDIKFADITKSVYEEPLLHHGYGFDLFIVK